MNHIELFAGCGGLSLGLETAGFELLLANELSPMASETFAYNLLDASLAKEENIDKVHWISSKHPREKITARLRENPLDASGLTKEHSSDLKGKTLQNEELRNSLLVGSIVDLNALLDADARLLSQLKSGFGDGGLDLISGGAPCQSFSLAGLREHSNARNQLPWEFAKFVEKLQPKLALLENVSGILRAFKLGSEKYFAWHEVAKAFAKVGYVPVCLHVNAKYVGAAQNRPRFILIAIRADVYKNFEKTNLGSELAEELLPFKKFFKNVHAKKLEPAYGSIPYLDIEKNPEIFEKELFLPLKTHSSPNFVSVKDAIDDLRYKATEQSEYVSNINAMYKQNYNHPLNKEVNHDARANNNLVRARFRIYQIMTKLARAESKEVSQFLKNGNNISISEGTLVAMQRHWVADLDGEKVDSPSKKEIMDLLGELHTKKQTQKALVADLPAPAALSIPDDACHYRESMRELRTLTVREMCRIQSFPDWYEIKSKVTTGGKMRRFEVPQYTQVGNAVPPILALALGKVCKQILESADKY